MALLRLSAAAIQSQAGSTTRETLTLTSRTSFLQTSSASPSYSSLRTSRRRNAGSEQYFSSQLKNRQLEHLLGFKNSAFPRMSGSTGKSGVLVKALQGAGRSPRRLVDVIRAIPRLYKGYFNSPLRRALYGGISLLGGFYVAQTISLSFGALGVNDVIAAAMCVLFAEYVTRFYYTREKVSFVIALLNNFKMGFTYGLFIDAFKLAS